MKNKKLNIKNKKSSPRLISFGTPLHFMERGIKGVRWILFGFWILGFGFSAWALPIVTNVELTSVSDNSVIITWSTTNEASSTEILWGSGGLTNTSTGPASSSTAVMSGTTKYHYVELKGLYQNTTYQYRIKSGDTVFPPAPWFSPLTFKTLERPSGEYLFSFAVLNDLRYAEDKANTQNARGIPYQLCSQIISSEVADINKHNVAFTVINGNIADESVTYNTQISSNLKGILENLTGAGDFTSNIAYKYLPTTGYHDKGASYNTDWITNSFNPLTSQTSIESVYGYNAASKDADSVFNYSFEYNNYNFIFLDSVKNGGAGGSANLGFLNDKISSSLKKTFIFMSFPGYNPLAASTKDYPLDIPTAEVGGGVLSIDNDAAFQATIEAFKDAAENPIVAAVISGHLGDNYKRDINSISYVRQGPALQYPTGYSIYKVYSTGYTKTFYKTTGSSVEADGDNKPYYEYARDQISGEVVSGQSVIKEALMMFWLGSNSNRNFTYQYAYIPGLAPRVISTSPGSSETSVGLNAPVLITFNKRMYADPNLAEWVSIKDSENNTITVSDADFIDASRTILQVSHTDFTVDKTYTITVNASKAKDEGSTEMLANYAFTFDTTGGTKDVEPPTAYISPLPNNSTTDPFPNFIGIATDESRVIRVKYRFDNTGDWISAEAVDGQYTGSVEVFQIKPSSPLSVGSHQLWLQTRDGAGNISAEGFSAYTFTVVIGDKPTITSFKIGGNTIAAGDPISAVPKIEIAITSLNSLESGRITIDSNQLPLEIVKVDDNYYATHEVTTALSDGIHGITFEAFDVLGNGTTYEVNPLYVQSTADTAIQGVPLNYPNPFDPGSQNTVIGYTLSKPGNITLRIFDLAGNLITTKALPEGQAGGRAGYNETTWDGKSDSGNYVGNGIYIYLIIADGKVVQNGKGKITVFKR